MYEQPRGIHAQFDSSSVRVQFIENSVSSIDAKIIVASYIRISASAVVDKIDWENFTDKISFLLVLP